MKVILKSDTGYFSLGELFIIQMKDVLYFTPNHKTHPAFWQGLIKAQEQGVKIMALECQVEADSIQARKWAEVRMMFL